jgi:outer membrane protein assembly factor BamB
MRNPCALVLILILLALCSVHAADWPHWRGPDYNGISRETNWTCDWGASGPNVLWRQNVGTGSSSFSVVKERVYTAGNSGQVKPTTNRSRAQGRGKPVDQESIFCLDALTGQELWSYTYKEPLVPYGYEGGPGATPTVHQGSVYMCSRKGKVVCVNAATGELKWRKDLATEFGLEEPTWGFSSSTVIKEDLVILNAGQWGMALDRHSGTKRWLNGTGVPGYASAIPFLRNGENQALIFGAAGLAAVTVETGQLMWSFAWKTRNKINVADPIVQDNRIFISSYYGKGCTLLEVRDQQIHQLWRNKKMYNHFSSSVLINGFLYGFSGHRLKCMDFNTGKVQWAQRGLGEGNFCAANNTLIVLNEKGKLVMVQASPEKYSPIASAQIFRDKTWTVPVLSNGLLYARDTQGNVVCLDLRK